MFSVKTKLFYFSALLFIALISCSRESSEPLWETKSNFKENKYNGGLFPVWITLKEPVENINSISWRTGNAKIAYRNQDIDSTNKFIKADTAFLHWEIPPNPFIKIDSTEIKQDSIITWQIDTVYYYRDTVFAIVNGEESEPIVIEVKNILPRIKKILVGGIEQDGDSILTIAANMGATNQEIEIHLEDNFNNSFHPTLVMPKEMGTLITKLESDSLWIYIWNVPNNPITDSSLYLKIEDSGGNYYGDGRLYKVHLFVYSEFGSVWVASENELVKFSPTGAEVARITGDFLSISDIAVNPKDGKLFVADKSKSSFFVYDTYGKFLYKSDSLFKIPTGVAIGVEGDYVWVADAKNETAAISLSRLRRFIFLEDSLRFSSVDYEMDGFISGLSVDQYQREFVWFTIPQDDSVGFVRNSTLTPEPKYITNAWNRPSMVSLDQSSGIAWIADSSRIVGIDSSGKVLAKIEGFSTVSSISASGGSVWATDIIAKKVYRFSGNFSGSSTDTSLTIINGMAVEGFYSPVFVNVYSENGNAWVIDKEAGKAILLDSIGNVLAGSTGLKGPYIGKVRQKWE